MKLKQMWKRFWTLDVHNHAGFTLVELIIVIAILAILSTGAIAGYSAYIAKANEAADKAMLAELNTAFAAACALNWQDNMLREDGPALTYTDKTVTGLKFDKPDENNAKIAEEFKNSIGNGFTFKVYDVSQLRYHKPTGSFVLATQKTLSTQYGDLVYFADELQAFKDSYFGEMDMGDLLTDVDAVVQWATGGNAATLLGSVQNDPAFKEFAAKTMGKAYDELDDEQKMTALVLYTAKQTEELDAETLFNGLMNNDGGTYNPGYAAEKDAMNIAGYAMEYALALAYYRQTPAYAQKYPNGENPEVQDVLDAMNERKIIGFDDATMEDIYAEKTEFQYWLETQGEENLKGYLAAMGMIADNTDNLETDDLLVDGFKGNDNLEGILEELLKQEP